MSNIKRVFARLTALAAALLLTVTLLPFAALAADTPTFHFDLSVDGQTSKRVETGDILTVTLVLKRTDKNEPYTMYAMQDEIRYDSSFFQLVEGGVIPGQGIHTTDTLAFPRPWREFYMNFLSYGGGENWYPEVRIGSFQLKVIATEGSSTISSSEYIVALADASGSYPVTANTVTVHLFKGYTVRFDAQNGKEPTEVVVEAGAKVAKPTDPQRNGYIFAGWYTDAACTKQWSFDNNTVTADITLYAKWSALPGDDTTEPATDPVTEPVTEPVTDPVTEPVTEPTEPTEPSGISPIWLVLGLLLLLILIILLIILLSRQNRRRED